MLRNFSLFVFYFILPYVLIAQVEITGTVSNESLEPLIGGTILIVDTKKGTVTDFDGNFSLTVDNLPVKIIISYTGYASLDTTLTEVKTYHFFLKEEVVELIEVTLPYFSKKSRTEWQRLQESTPNLVRAIAYLKDDEGSFIQNALNNVPGVFMHSGGLNTNRITIRGIGNRNLFGTAKLKAYFNEIPLTNGVGESSIEDFPLTPIQELNIVKGPNSSIYGAGLGGAIYLKTNTDYYRESPLKVYTTNTFGSYGLMKNAVGFTSNSFQVDYSRLKQDGYRANNEYERHNFHLAATLPLGNKHLLMPLFLHTNLKAFIPSSLNREDYENEPEKAAFTWGRVKGFEDYKRTLAGLSYDIQLNDHLSANASLYGTLFQSYESRPFNILEENSNSFGGRALFSWDYLIKNTRGKLRIGTEWYRENYDWEIYATDLGIQGDLLSDNEEVRTTQNIFAQASLDAPDWEAQVGLSFNTINYNLEDNFKSDSLDVSGDYTFTPTLSPSLSFTYNLTHLTKIYSIISHGFSPPSLEETLLPEGTINTAIQPEKGWNFELGIRKQKYSPFQYNISIYSMQIKDLLVARRTDFDQFIGINAGKSVHSGLEIQTDYTLRKGSTWEIHSFLNYTYSDYKFKEFIDTGNDYSGNFLTGTAPHRLNVGIRWKQYKNYMPRGFYGNINYQFVDAMPLRDDNSIYSESYHLTNAKIGYKKPFKPFNIDLFMGINNIFDMKYASMLLINAGSFGGAAPRYYYPGLPRNYYAGLKVDFQFKKRKVRKYWLERDGIRY